MLKTVPNFKEKLSQVEKAGSLGYCCQCSACVAECPAAKNSIIWQCATCYKCYKRCPQGTRPVEVITVLKNSCHQDGNAPEDVLSSWETVISNGSLVIASGAIQKRRDELGLEGVPDISSKELEKLLE